jgi:hypothetical protein
MDNCSFCPTLLALDKTQEQGTKTMSRAGPGNPNISCAGCILHFGRYSRPCCSRKFNRQKKIWVCVAVCSWNHIALVVYERNMNREGQWCYDTDRGQEKYSDRNLTSDTVYNINPIFGLFLIPGFLCENPKILSEARKDPHVGYIL